MVMTHVRMMRLLSMKSLMMINFIGPIPVACLERMFPLHKLTTYVSSIMLDSGFRCFPSPASIFLASRIVAFCR